MGMVAYTLDRKDVAELREEFQSLDTAQNGVLSQKEFKQGLKAKGLSDSEIQEIFKSVDYDESNNIHYLEFLAATLCTINISEDKYKTAFNKLDRDKSGSISVKNLTDL